MAEHPVHEGGCQCGAVRFSVGRLGRGSICHCRMCQKAFGSFFGPRAISRIRACRTSLRSETMSANTLSILGSKSSIPWIPPRPVRWQREI